jgi:nitroreductase
MDAIEALRKRRSIRKYRAEAVPRADLETIVDAGRLAATGSNRQPWDFIVVTERDRIAQLSASGSWMAEASAVIVVVMNPASRWWVEDGAAAIENMLLACTAFGYGSCWVEGDLQAHEERFKSLLGVPQGRRLMAILPVGLPAEAPEPQKRSLESVLHWEKF